MKRVRALQPFVGRKVGEEFDLEDNEARILSAPDGLGGQKVEIIDIKKLKAQPTETTVENEPRLQKALETRDMQAESDRPRRGGRYDRRDMRARD